MPERVRRLTTLPTDMPPLWRQTLEQVFQEISRQVNWTSIDVTAIATSQAVGHDFVKVDASASAVTVTLPKPNDWFDRILRVKKIDATSNPVNVVCHDGSDIDGTPTVAISTQYIAFQFISDGKNWWVV